MKAYNPRNALLFVAGIAALLISIGPANAQTLGEALGATNLVWTTGGDVPWLVETTNTYNGNAAAAQSGITQSNQISWLETTVVGPATISFWDLELVSGFFSPSFTINGVSPNSGYFVNSWNQSIYDLGTGTNVLLWTAQNAWFGNGTGTSFIDEFSVSQARPLSIEYQPYGSTVYSGTDASISVQAIGTPPYQYQWYLNGTNIVGATNSLLVISQTTTNDTGLYSVLVTNSQGSVLSSNALLTVLPPSPPIFIWEPEDTVAYVGQSFYWYASVDGSPPFTYQWLKNGTNLPGATSESLSLPSPTFADAGSYALVVSNSFGSIESTNAVLTVIQPVAPTITNQPRSLDVATGVNTWMTVGATGVPAPSYAWTDASLPPAPPSQFPPIPPVNNPSGTKSFKNVTATNAGVYYATASNYGGQAVSQEALLTVLPAITNAATWNQDAVDLFVTNGLAFLARGTNGLAILSVTNPASPQLLGTFPTTG